MRRGRLFSGVVIQVVKGRSHRPRASLLVSMWQVWFSSSDAASGRLAGDVWQQKPDAPWEGRSHFGAAFPASASRPASHPRFCPLLAGIASDRLRRHASCCLRFHALVVACRRIHRRVCASRFCRRGGRPRGSDRHLRRLRQRKPTSRYCRAHWAWATTVAFACLVSGHVVRSLWIVAFATRLPAHFSCVRVFASTRQGSPLARRAAAALAIPGH